MRPPSTESDDLEMTHSGCGGIVEWEDIDDTFEGWVCQKCGEEVDGENMEVR